MKPFPWPVGIRCAVFVSVNFDAEVFDLKSTTDTGQLAQTTASLTALMKQPGVVFKRLSWSNQDDAAFAGVMAFNPKTGLITSFGWMNEP